MTRFRKRIIRLALALCIISLSACQPTPEERLNKAEEYIASAEYRTAVIELQNLLQAAPDNAQARLLLAQTSYQLGDFSQATSQFERAISLGESDASTWISFGRTLLSQGRAMDALERSLRIWMGWLIMLPYSSFLATFNTLLITWMVPKGTTLKLSRFRRQVWAGLSARQWSKRVGATTPRPNDCSIRRHSIILMPRRSGWPEDKFSRQIGTLRRRHWRSRMRFVCKPTHTPLAEEFSSRVSLISTLIDSRQFDAAEANLIELKTSFPDHPVSDFLQGRLAFAQGDYDNAQMALQDYLSKNAGDVRGRAILGAINFSQDNLRQAESHLIAAVRANAGGEATRRLLAETRLRLNNPGGALDVLLSPDGLDQTDALYLSMVGRAQLAAGDDEAALEYFRKGVEQEPGNDALTLALASTYLRVDRAEQAIDVLDNMPDKGRK